MIWRVDWDGDFVVGGDGNRRLTPNFRVKEFRRADGGVRVHRELVTALQMLRNRFGRALSVRATDADGLGAQVQGEPEVELAQAIDAVNAVELFATVAPAVDGCHLRIPDPAGLAPINLEQALETAFSVTAAFETSGDRFLQVAGNFDGAGLSFGPAQVNFKSGTLVSLFRMFEQADADRLRDCFSEPEDWEEWQQVLALPRDQQIAWADALSTGRGKHDLVQPWKGYLQNVGKVVRFRAIMVEEILREYGSRVLRCLDYLQQLAPIPIDHLRCLCALYDLVIQQGSLDKAKASIEARVQNERPQDQFALVRIAVEERGRKANSRWRADCVSRRLGILTGVPVTCEESGTVAQRANINFYLLRDVRVRGAREPTKADLPAGIARVSAALAAGETVLV